MTTIWADFNARTTDDRIRLTTVGSARDLAATGTKPGTWAWLSDGEVRVGAVVEESRQECVARVAWETAEEVLPKDAEVAPSAPVTALRELQALNRGTGRDYRRMLRLLPLAERAMAPGRADYFRSRAAQAFGYPHLALLAIEDALRKDPGRPGFVHQRLDLLKTIDLDRAFEEARRLARDPTLPAILIASCASIYNAAARQLDNDGMAQVERELLELTDRFEGSPSRDSAPASTAAMVHVTRGFAILHLSEIHMADRAKGIEEFNKAVQANPMSAEALAARGLETYPDAKSIADLEMAIELGTPSFWPAYYLAHHYADARDWSKAARFVELALRVDPPARVRANLLEWQGIAQFQSDGDAVEARRLLLQARDLAPDNEHLLRNLALLEQLGPSSSTPTDWALTRDAEKRTSDVQLAA